MEQVKIGTSDGLEIIGDYYEARGAKVAALLLHMMPSTRESWQEFSCELRKAGFCSLAIDLRGHGESSMGPEGYKGFTDKEHQGSILDVEAAIRFLNQKGFSLDNIFLVGASIGANLALQYQAEHQEVKAVVLLSPGLNYRGILGGNLAEGLKESQAVFVAGSKHDCGYRSEDGSFQDKCASLMAQEILNRANAVNKQIKLFDNSAHGTTMLLRNPGFSAEIIEWLKEIY
jgi:pimeloyl-ACP methyl ester carboxylesterase